MLEFIRASVSLAPNTAACVTLVSASVWICPESLLQELRMDALSEVLKVVKLEGALFYNAEFSSPWRFGSPASRLLAPYLAPGAEHVIIYHLLIEGRGLVRLKDGECVDLEAGDIVIFPHGDAHVVENGPGAKAVDSWKELKQVFSERLKLVRMGGGGEVTKFVCGYMTCEPRLAQILLAGLPPVFKVNIRNDAAGQWLESSIRFSVSEVDGSRPGSEAVLAKLSETLFVETLRRYIGLLPEQKDRLAGRRTRPGGWESVGDDASVSGASLDAC